MRICLVSRELYPYVGGGIAPIVAAAARALSGIAEVTLVTTSRYRDEHERLVAAGDPRVAPPNVEIVFVDEPEPGEGYGGCYGHMHAYSVRVLEALRSHYGDRGPDILEFPDYLAEGFATIQARRTGAAWLADTLVCVRLHTTAELCAILDGHVDAGLETESVFEAERYCLRHADRVLWSGGDTLETYRRVYGTSSVAEGVLLPDAFLDETAFVPDRSGGVAEGESMRLLYLGRAERRKGIHDLVRALLDTGLDNWHLTVVGGDTDTGPLGTSMADQLRLITAGDPRVEFADPVARADVGALIRRHAAVVVPSRWECWPNVAREALQHNRPVFATPVGGLTAMVRPGVSGWLASGTGRRELRRSVAALLEDPTSATDLIAAGGPRRVFDELCDEDLLRERYQALAAASPRPRVAGAPSSPPLVSVIVPYYRMDKLVEETLDSVAAQTYGAIETIVVNDGSLREEDHAVLGRVAERPGVTVVTQTNAGLGAARNFGISQAAGAYVLPLDADDLIVPEFVERVVGVLEMDPELAYVGTWVQYMDEDAVDYGSDIEGYFPYGNWSTMLRRGNVGGVCTCLFRRAIFDAGFSYDDELTSYEDWLLFRELDAAGLHGEIIPEKLFRYRVRQTSMMRTIGSKALDRFEGEITARMRERAVRWTAGPTAVGDGRRTAMPPEPAPDGEVAERTIDELRVANAQLAGAAATGRRGAAAAVAVKPRESAQTGAT